LPKDSRFFIALISFFIIKSFFLRDYIFQESEERKLSTEATEKNVEFGKEKNESV